MVDGKEITLGNIQYTLPPIPLSGLSKLGNRIASIGTDSPESILAAGLDAAIWLRVEVSP